MEKAIGQGACQFSVPEISAGTRHEMHRLSISEFPPLLNEEFRRSTPRQLVHPHGKTHPRNTLSQDSNNNNMSNTRTTRKELKKKKFRPDNMLLHFKFSYEEDFPVEHSSIRADVLRDLENICQEYSLADWTNSGKHGRMTWGKLGRSFEDRYIRGKLGVGLLPPGKAKRMVNFRSVSRKNKMDPIVSDNREKRKRNTEKKLDLKGLRRGIGNERYRIDISTLNTATQQRVRRNAIGGTVSVDVETAMRPTTFIRRRRGPRWDSSRDRDQERNQFELHHDNIACMAPDIKNEDDLWQLMNIQHRELTPEDYELLLQLDESVAPKTVSEETLSNLRVATVGEAELAGSLSGQLCSICIEEYSVGEKVKYLPCDHFYHEKCIDNWLTFSDSKCPLDGFEIS